MGGSEFILWVTVRFAVAHPSSNIQVILRTWILLASSNPSKPTTKSWQIPSLLISLKYDMSASGAHFAQNVPNFYMYDDHELSDDYDLAKHGEIFELYIEHYWNHFFGQKNPTTGGT